MARRARFNRQGEIIMGAAASHAKIFSTVELSEKTGIPYQKLHRRLSGDFGMTTADELRAIFKVTGMTEQEIAEVWK